LNGSPAHPWWRAGQLIARVKGSEHLASFEEFGDQLKMVQKSFDLLTTFGTVKMLVTVFGAIDGLELSSVA
jgi:hypothetical protein